MNQANVKVIIDNYDHPAVQAMLEIVAELELKYKEQLVSAAPDKVQALQEKVKFLREFRGKLIPPRGRDQQQGKDGAYS